MNLLSDHVVALLWFLLPGFVAMWVFAGLTAYPKLTEFERVVEALIFMTFAQAGTFLVRFGLLQLGAGGHVWGTWTTDVERLWSVGLAVLLGLIFATSANHDLVHRLLRRMRVTKQTGYPSEWFGAFNDRGRAYVVLHLTGERRLYGWAEEWPTEHSKGHFSIAEAEWLLDGNKRQALAGVAHILVPATEVSFVEFMEPYRMQPIALEDPDEQKAAAATTSASA